MLTPVLCLNEEDGTEQLLCIDCLHRSDTNGPGGSGEGVVGGPKTPQQIAAQRRLQQTQAQVDEVKN